MDEEGEVRGVWRRTAQEGFWVAAGGFWISRYYSRVLAVKIAVDLKAREEMVESSDEDKVEGRFTA